MTTGATIHTTNGLWLVPKARQMQQEQHAAGAGAGVAAAAFTEQRELALAFTEPAKPQQQTTATP